MPSRIEDRKQVVAFDPTDLRLTRCFRRGEMIALYQARNGRPPLYIEADTMPAVLSHKEQVTK